MTIEADVRTPLKEAFESAGIVASCYPSMPDAFIAPLVAILPDAPYLESTLINSAVTKVKINFVISAAVNYQNNAAALDNLEQLVISILGAMPSGYEVGNVNQPTPLEIQTGKYLVADLLVSTYYNEIPN